MDIKQTKQMVIDLFMVYILMIYMERIMETFTYQVYNHYKTFDHDETISRFDALDQILYAVSLQCICWDFMDVKRTRGGKWTIAFLVGNEIKMWACINRGVTL